MEEKRPTGRPSDYTDSLGDKICAQITVGISLATICKEEGMPDPATVYRWMRVHESFRKNYEQAKSDQADYFVEEMMIIPDTEVDVQRARLKVDTRKWAASKFKPKKYGDSTQLRHADANGELLTFSTLLGDIDGRSAGLPGTEEEAE